MNNSISGLYKLSETTINRLITRTVIGKDGKRLPGASRSEISAIIYLSHISDQDGNIEMFRAQEFADAIGCSLRNCYMLIKNLEKKAFISINSKEWTGYMSITLLDNRFSDIKEYTKHTRYLNTNNVFFDQHQDSFYEQFKSLSLYAMRLYLYLLFQYSIDFGYSCSYEYLASKLQLKNKRLIASYLKEITPLIDNWNNKPSYSSFSDIRKRTKYGRIVMPAKNNMMVPDSGIRADQDSYYKRYWIRRIGMSGYVIEGLYFHWTLMDYADKLYQLASHFISKKISRELIEKTITQQVETDGILNERTLFRINDRLEFLSSS